jgi:hypothetical protein
LLYVNIVRVPVAQRHLAPCKTMLTYA